MRVEGNISFKIIPFVYKGNYRHFKNSIQEMKNQKNKILWKKDEDYKRTVRSYEDLYEHVLLFNINEQSNNEVGEVYTIEETKKLNSTNFLSIKEGDLKIGFKIPKAKLYVFRTQIAFLVLEIEYMKKNMDIDELILANYYMTRLKLNKDRFSRKKGKNEEEKISYVEEILELLPDNQYIFFSGYSKEKDKKIPSLAIMYNYTIVEDTRLIGNNYLATKKELKNKIIYMGKSFKPTYKLNLEQIEQNKGQIYQPFENSFWVVSKESCSNLVYVTDDDETNKFFRGGYKGNFKYTYLYIYILALHQYYGMIYLAKRISEFPADTNQYIPTRLHKSKKTKMRTDNYLALKQAKETVHFFYFKCMFEDISYVTHQHRLYSIMRESLCIEQLKKELQFEIETIGNIVEEVNQKYYSEKSKKNSQLFIMIGTSLTVVSTLSAIIGGMESYLESNGRVYVLAQGITCDKLMLALYVFLIIVGVMITIYLIYITMEKLTKR